MAGDVQVKLEIPGSCCALWKNKYSKLEEKRNALRQAVKLLEQQIDKIQAANKKEFEEERARVGFEKESKERESSARVALEKEVGELKSEILSLKRGSDNRDVNGEVKILEGRVAEGEREIKRLKEAVLSERKRAEAERKNAEVEKRKAAEELKVVETVKLEKEIAERYRLQMDALKKEADEVRSKLAAEMGKFNDTNKKLEAEKKRVAKETKRADLEHSKAEQHRKLVEAFKQKALEEKNYAETLSQQLADSKNRIDEVRDSKSVFELSLKLEEVNKKLQLEKHKTSREKERADGESAKVESHKKIAEGNLKKAAEEKSRADNLRTQLEEGKKKISEFEKQSKKLLSSKAASEEVNFLKKQLKFEKAKRKHSKQVVELERSRNSLLQQEVARLKLEFDQFSCRLDLINKSFSPSGASGVRDSSKKNGIVVDTPRSALNHSLRDMDTSGTFRQTVPIRRLSPVPGGTCVEPITGTNSKLESLLGGSTRKSPAINSSTTSFSNGQLVGSQDKGAFSVTTSEKLVEEHAQPSGSEMSDEVTAMRSGEYLAVVAENSVRGSVSSAEAGKINMNTKKRKRILDTVETIENLYTKDKKLHLQIEEKLALLHGFVDRDLDQGVKDGKFWPPTVLGSSGVRHDKSTKKRKTLFQQSVADHARRSSELKMTDEVEIQVHRQASSTANKLISRESKGEGTQGLNSINDFEKRADGDYMNLLNLDDATFEEYYRVAMEIPLSPTLPEIEIPCADICDMGIAVPVEGFCENLSNKEDVVLLSHGRKISSNMSNSRGIASSASSFIHEEQTPINTLGAKVENWHASHVVDASVCLSHSDAGFQNSGVTITRDEKSHFTSTHELGLSDKILQYAVVFSNITNKSSISRLYYTIRGCMAQFSLASQTRWMVREILLAIKMEEKLAAKEKLCAIFSLLMINFSVVALGKFGDYLNWASKCCLDSFAGHVLLVMSDVEIANIFIELGGLVELLSLIESFLVDERFKVVRDVSFGSSVDCDSGDTIQIDGSNAALSFIPASAEQLVAGSIVLAAISSALDHISFMCETSYNVLRSQRLGSSLILSILHIFAYLGGDKFFRARDHRLLMTVVRPIVRSIEGLSQRDGSFCCTSLVRGDQTVHCERMTCPFWDENGDALSVDTVTSLLLEKVKADDKLEQLHKHDTEQVYCVASSNLTDLLALLELVACHMGWEWTSDKIIPKLSNILESSALNNSSSGIVILIGQVGRLGIQAFGYEDKKVEQIRSDLSAFLQRAITAEAGLPLQLATVASLVGLFSVDFATILQTKGNSNFGSADAIRKWYSSLIKKHQDLSLKVLRSVK